ncbi:Uncharacterized protein LSUE1_G006996 [Lachnellula suecica]|uniref:FAD-binding domain-containing protein n=1 Tax=Lachnellula suecica TaxID=602035 RepID=A0A8T9C0H1_9HELO|nr:Uncharacterized protein LSUE1_G006996 [Lachnellula suecica]
MVPMKVLISGGGIAGNALAFWLSKLGHKVTVIEWFPTLRTAGLQIDLRGHGIEVMKRMGLEQAIRAKLVPEQGLQVVDSSGKRRAFFPANTSGKGAQNFTTEYEIMRGDFCRLMYDATKSRVKYVFGSSVESYKENDTSVEVRFTDGKTEQFDLWVGADGPGSRTRKMMLGPGAADAFHPMKGVYVAYYTIPRPIQKGEEYVSTMYMATGHRGLMTRRSNPDQIQIYIGCTTDSVRLKNVRRGDVVEEKAALQELFQGAGWQSEEIAKAAKDADDFYCERIGIVKLESWFRGRVALVGDAAYCPSANTGMGTTSAIVGAYILAGEIGRHCGGENPATKQSLAIALEAYNTKFQPFMTQVQKGVLEEGGFSNYFPSSSFGIAVMYRILGIASFFKVNMGKWMLKEEVKDWELPDYEEL